MWEVEKEEITESITKYRILKNGVYLSYQLWMDDIQQSDEFAEFFVKTLKSSPYQAFFWEVKPVNQHSIEEVFEFVLIESSTLANLTADEQPFREHFLTNDQVINFPNLGGDAQLIVPTPMSDTANYNHLASFIRKAPKAQILQFWKIVALQYQKIIGDKTKWLSTAGLGVSWLHVRIDARPKYYRFSDYKIVR